MNKYNHPLLAEVDYSQAKEPAMEMLLTLQQQKDSLDWNGYLTKPFETPLFSRIDAIQLAEENEQFEFVLADGKMWKDFPLGMMSQYRREAPGLHAFIITMADSTSGLVGGYRLPCTAGFHLVFDRLLWEDCGQPLDGRGFRLLYTGCQWQPVVMGAEGTFLLSDYSPIKKMVPYFPDRQTAEKLAADFALKTSDPQACRLVSHLDLQVVEAMRQQPGWEGFSFADWQKSKADMKQQLKSSSTGTLLHLHGILPLPTWGGVDADGVLHLCFQIPGREWITSLSPSFRPFEILAEYAHARPKSDFYQRYSKETLLTVIEVICTCLDIRSNLKLEDVPYLTQWRYTSDIWFGGEYSKVAQILVDHRLEPFQDEVLRSPNAHLLMDAEISQWLPADFEITDQNKEGIRTFLVGVLYDLRDLTAKQTAGYFQQCLCSPQAQEVGFEKMAGAIQLLDLMEDGYFQRGQCSFGWWFYSGVGHTHARCCYDGSLCWHPWSFDPLPFSWKEQVVLNGFAFQMPKSEADLAKTGQYCGLEEPEVFSLASGRIPPVIVSLADSPRVPIGVVHPLSTDFELSEEFYQTLSEPKGQFTERFKKIVEQYWEIFDKKYPYLY